MDIKHLEGKRVFWSKKWDKLWLLTIPVTAFAYISFSDKYSRPTFWIFLIISSAAIVYIVWNMINPRNVWIDPETPEGAELYSLAKELRQKEILDLQFSAEGFLMITPEEERIVKWQEVKSIFVYKTDQFTVDQLHLDLFLTTKGDLQMTEDHPGWNELLDRLCKAFPTIDADFYGKLIYPPFETNFTLLYDAEGRSQDEAAREYYSN